MTHRTPPTALALYFLLSLLIASCSPAPRANPDNIASSPTVQSRAREAVKRAPRRIVQSGPVELAAARPDGDPAWSLKGQSSRAGLQEGGSTEVFATSVSGEVFEKGKPTSRFTANEAKAISATRQLVLTGKATVKAVQQDITIRAQNVRWMDDRQLFAAEGRVTVESPEWILGPMDTVWANADLTRVGSPEKFD